MKYSRSGLVYIIIVIIISAFSFSACGNPSPGKDTTQNGSDADVVIRLDASNYKYSITEITVKKDQKIRIEMTVTQGIHDWVLDEFDAATNQIGSGRTAVAEFIADQTGDFEYYCSVSNHRALGMTGVLTVEE